MIIAASVAFGAPQDESGSPSRESSVGFPWFVVPQSSGGTQVLNDFERIWREDTIREERKERLYWDKLRAAEEQRIRHRYRVETQIALQRAVAVAAAQRALATKKTRSFSGSVSGVGGAVEDGTPPRSTAEDETIAEKIDDSLKNLQKKATGTVDLLDRMVDEIVIPRPGTAAAQDNRGFVFFLLLLAVFLVPAVAVSLILLAILQLRHGHRLQSAIFGLAGCTMLALVAAAREEVRSEDPVRQRAEVARLSAECEASAVRVAGFVYAAVPGGVLVTDVTGAPADEHGWVVILTEKQTARSGEMLKLQVYPVGVQKAENALGLIRSLPAYADTLEAAVGMRAKEAREASQWWWQRMLRSIREA